MIEQRERQVRKKEFQREDFIKQLATDKVFGTVLACEEGAHQKRRLRHMKERDMEVDTYLQLVQVCASFHRILSLCEISIPIRNSEY